MVLTHNTILDVGDKVRNLVWLNIQHNIWHETKSDVMRSVTQGETGGVEVAGSH